MPRRLMVRLRTLTPSIEVRILTGHPVSRHYGAVEPMGPPGSCARAGASILEPSVELARVDDVLRPALLLPKGISVSDHSHID